jgi:hypothetical protein
MGSGFVIENGKSAHVSPSSEQEFDQRLKPLIEQWQAQDKKGLDMRFDLGKVLNEHIGPPTTRSKRGKGVVAKVCAALKVTKFEVSRARNFAHAFGSIEDFVGQHPTVTTWAAVKELLPKLKRQEEGQGDGTETGSGNEGAMKDPTPKKMDRHLKGFSEEFLVVQSFLSMAELDNLKSRVSGILEHVQFYHFQRSGALAAKASIAGNGPVIHSQVR